VALTVSKMLELDHQGPLIGGLEIYKLEQEFGAELPSHYREVLLKYNGGSPSPDIVDVAGLVGSPTDLQVFFSIDPNAESSDIFWNLRLLKERFLDHRILPIACDSGGDLFCLEPSGEVVYMVLNSPLGATYKVSSDFRSFLAGIRDWKE
jgi:hypothetical protein